MFKAESKKGFEQKTTTFLLTCLVLSSFIYQLVYTSHSFLLAKDSQQDDYSITSKLAVNEPIKVLNTRKITYLKPDIEEAVNQLPGKFIAIVSYDEKFSFFDEIVFNKADIENSKMIWANDLGDEKNAALLNYYSDRKVLQINISDSKIEIIPATYDKFND